MNLRQVIPAEMTASVAAHLSVLALVVLFSEVHPFGAVTAEPIAVDIVTAREIENKPEPVDQARPTTDLSAPANPVAEAAPPGSQPAAPGSDAVPEAGRAGCAAAGSTADGCLAGAGLRPAGA
jgi:hypothetical protein